VTIGGGHVLDASPGKHKRFSGRVLEGLEKLGGTSRDAVEQMFIQSGGVPQGVHEIALKLGRREPEVAEVVADLLSDGSLIAIVRERPEKFLHKTVYARLADELIAGVRAYFETNPFRPTMPFSDVRVEFLKESDAPTLKFILDELIGKGVLYRKEAEIGLVGREARANPVEDELRARVEGVFRSARFAAPLEDEVYSRLDLNLTLFKKTLDSLIRDGRLVRLAPKVTYHREALEAAREAVAGLIERHGSVTIAELRDRLNLSRKYAQAILEYFDKTGLTKRVEDRHVLAKP
jgi:selenocysteine-specific elongation factor